MSSGEYEKSRRNLLSTDGEQVNPVLALIANTVARLEPAFRALCYLSGAALIWLYVTNSPNEVKAAATVFWVWVIFRACRRD